MIGSRLPWHLSASHCPQEFTVPTRSGGRWSRMCSRDLVYALMCAGIGVISFYDAVLVFMHRRIILDFECNPMGRLLIEMQQGDVTAFLVAKMLGTLIVLGVLAFLYRRFERYAYPITGSVTAFQLGLLGYLNIM